MRTDNPIPTFPPNTITPRRSFLSILWRLFRRGLGIYIQANMAKWEAALSPDLVKAIAEILAFVERGGEKGRKKQIAFDLIKTRYPELSDRVINQSIELMCP